MQNVIASLIPIIDPSQARGKPHTLCIFVPVAAAPDENVFRQGLIPAAAPHGSTTCGGGRVGGGGATVAAAAGAAADRRLLSFSQLILTME